MKKIAGVIMMVLLLATIVGTANAEPKLLPEGAVVTADVSGPTATVTVKGVRVEDVEFYGYEGVKHLGAVNAFTVNLREGRRFNLKFDGYYALVTPDMAAYPPDFFGQGVKPECSNPAGCCFVITTKKR